MTENLEKQKSKSQQVSDLTKYNNSFEIGAVIRQHTADLDSATTVTFFRKMAELSQGTYFRNSSYTMQLAFGTSSVNFLGRKTVSFEYIVIEKSVDVKSLNGPLISTGRLCGTKTILLSRKKSSYYNKRYQSPLNQTFHHFCPINFDMC